MSSQWSQCRVGLNVLSHIPRFQFQTHIHVFLKSVGLEQSNDPRELYSLQVASFEASLLVASFEASLLVVSFEASLLVASFEASLLDEAAESPVQPEPLLQLLRTDVHK